MKKLNEMYNSRLEYILFTELPEGLKWANLSFVPSPRHVNGAVVSPAMKFTVL